MPSGADAVLSKDPLNPEQRWSALLDEAGRCIEEHDTVGARAVLQEAISYVDETWGADDVHLIRLLRLMAESYWREHEPLDPNNRQEVDCLRRALAVARRRLSPDHLEVARLAAEVGVALVIAGDRDEGCTRMVECLEIARKNGCEEDFARYLSLIGDARMEQEQPTEALTFYERAARLSEDRDPSSIPHALDRYHLGRCLVALCRYDEAIDQLQVALGLADAKRVHGKYADIVNEIMDTIERAERGALAAPTKQE